MSSKYYKKKPMIQGVCDCGEKFIGKGKYCNSCKDPRERKKIANK